MAFARMDRHFYHGVCRVMIEISPTQNRILAELRRLNGGPIPSRRDLAVRVGTALSTMESALLGLERAGVLAVNRKEGRVEFLAPTKVREPVERGPSKEERRARRKYERRAALASATGCPVETIRLGDEAEPGNPSAARGTFRGAME